MFKTLVPVVTRQLGPNSSTVVVSAVAAMFKTFYDADCDVTGTISGRKSLQNYDWVGPVLKPVGTYDFSFR